MVVQTKKTLEFEGMQSGPQTKNKLSRGWTGLAQLSLVEHSLCPLDPDASLVDNLVHQSSYFFTDKHKHVREATARIVSPAGLSTSDEFYLWGLLALTFAQPEVDSELHATPHYCLRQLGVIDHHSRRGGVQYQQFEKTIERLSQVTYLNDRFFDPVRAEHRKVSFGFLSYSLPIDPGSSRAWRIAWDPIFFDIIRAAGGSFRFDLATYKELDPASRRLFLLLSKIFWRRPVSPRFDVRHLGVNVLGFSSSLTTADLKIKVWRCVECLTELQVVRPVEKERLFRRHRRAVYSLVLEAGDYFATSPESPATPIASAFDELLMKLGFDESGARRLQRQYPATLLREWIDVTQAALEEFGRSYFRRSPQAHLVDNLKNAKAGKRTPPDWYHSVRRAEHRAATPKPAVAPVDLSPTPELPEQSRQSYEQVANDIFRFFCLAGQPESAAKANAEKFAGEFVRRGDTVAPLLTLLKK
jgi:hypothetical protein